MHIWLHIYYTAFPVFLPYPCIFSLRAGAARAHWASAHFLRRFNYVIIDESSVVSVRLMSLCTHHVLTSSTLSFWGERSRVHVVLLRCICRSRVSSRFASVLRFFLPLYFLGFFYLIFCCILLSSFASFIDRAHRYPSFISNRCVLGRNATKWKDNFAQHLFPWPWPRCAALSRMGSVLAVTWG